jgi:hypothetical protein
MVRGSFAPSLLASPTVVEQVAPFSPAQPGQLNPAGLKRAGRATASPSRHDEVGGADLALAERDDVSTAGSVATEERSEAQPVAAGDFLAVVERITGGLPELY